MFAFVILRNCNIAISQYYVHGAQIAKFFDWNLFSALLTFISNAKLVSPKMNFIETSKCMNIKISPKPPIQTKQNHISQDLFYPAAS